ncbi:hypothetical protein M9458_057449 [Cirrhinus mrigala]|uniref:Uncharacterized protein n=1 Tax=Cirrhinus mrigala TaxID=683832 RepID=A0ABD0MEZ8_CIRMR
MPLLESTCCTNCHSLLQRIVVFETKLLAGLPKQAEHSTDRHHGPPQHTADMAMIRLAKTGILPPPIQLENRFEALMNVGEESPNVIKHGSVRNISSRTTTTCCFPRATISDVNKELRNILIKHKAANRIIIHVGKNDIRKKQSELLKKDFSELIKTL